MVSNKLVGGIQLVDPKVILEVFHCCAYGKQHHAPFPSHSNRIKAHKPSILFHNDLSWKMPIDFLRGSCYYILFKDDHYGYQLVLFSVHKFDTLSYFKVILQQSLCETNNQI